jgi:hypothetical protein
MLSNKFQEWLRAANVAVTRIEKWDIAVIEGTRKNYVLQT